ncbi:PTS system D-glucose-specific IIA component, Glc family (TC 4.A.1.1.9)/PTS system D-glucose-specific IIB component, Glc family (TC 4.A.1.1.9)/PTS system D-glucose-specific IIC component, Glc family (TC 4.A.1.1.9) [Anaerobranca californiensis DSM 14826]|uniref:PTS system D-glucose-specific IIA component, Glc family (TC 4.A.1.1.9)/PTS system D-glucose-specific IIB component, Glc family (TC 4.A.1.1.9)/PTS system D-glucose-specific IIC component, Glc family... n=1 Tax=Anaerobranca californiensis DSM 14826 TaxID=1120989 RepID=A0A1M6Q8J7_9FIRM|nr:glucose-specific PTS transporter subunit IIBC [Anaerobranca californiensis]SHK16470.1 PTS system D-glucose-specific IIA component, Glc family (TC 4.A.1.1.9)/PTS system D-glucose-specific IIB component, Glc family (TC 4.A.1.1.9)/PTS system D-glucose-specific IIC component, Glc family (TC 4.A.1.1.9) [Anaerobranca californiensis DSM 14826]
MKKSFAVLQQVGKALMLPVAILPAAGILLAFGNALQNPALLERLPYFNTHWVQMVAVVMEQAGGIIFSNLPLLFAVGVAVGLTGGEGVAGLAAIIGYLIMNVTMGIIAGVTLDSVGSDPAYTLALGIPTLQTGVFGGIIVGVLASFLYKKYYNIELPQYLGFFAGKRFVPIITAVSALLLGILMTVIWPPIQLGLNTLSYSMVDSNRTLSAFVFGVIERALIPFGLHHIFYSPFWFEFGEYVNKAGEIVRGDQRIFFEQLKDNVPFTAGTFMTGKFPFMMFGLPAAALAMYHEAKTAKKKYVAGIMMSAALTSFLTGITEPIEFTFLFVAPLLFAVHTVFAGLSFMIMEILNVKIGMTFSGGVIDYLLFGVLPNRTQWWLVIPVGLVFSVIYYFGFRFVIRKWDIKTPGRENDGEEIEGNGVTGELGAQVLEALGGQENILNLDACITRLRVNVKNIKDVDKQTLKKLGATGVLEVGNSIQAIFGPKSDIIKSQIDNIIKNGGTKGKTTKFLSPMEGKLVDLTVVPDKVFSKKIMGEGFAIEPSKGEVVSPVDGKVVSLFPTNHAIGIQREDGLEVLIHIGIDTVELKGEGFKALVKEGDEVKAGQPLINVDLEKIKGKGKAVITPIVFTNLPEGQKVYFEEGKKVQKGQSDIIVIK